MFGVRQGRHLPPWQLVAMVANGFTGLLTSLFQATGQAVAATAMAMTQGLLFIPVVVLGNLWFGLSGIIWSLTVTEGAAFLVGVVLWFVSRAAIDRGLTHEEARLDEPDLLVVG